MKPHHTDRPDGERSGGLLSSAKNAPTSLRVGAFFVLSIAFVSIGSIALYKSTSYQKALIEREEELKAGPTVRVAQVGHSLNERMIEIIGEAHPYSEVTLYAKVSGYLKEIYVDKGDKVKKDQKLALIESPETDKSYQGALADADNKRAIANRMKTLLKQQLVSPQEAEQAESDASVSEARLEGFDVQKSYETLSAPFAGTITSRFADPGALVQNAMSSQTSALPLVTISEVNRLRIYIYLDQRDATFVTVGDPAEITLLERPDYKAEAKIDRISGELDLKTRMLLAEIDLDNQRGELVAGSSVQVHLKIKKASLLEIPVEALVIKQDKVSVVPVLSKDSLIHYRPVKVHSNDGAMVTILSGLEAGETVVLNIGYSLPEGSRVKPLTPIPSKE